MGGSCYSAPAADNNDDDVDVGESSSSMNTRVMLGYSWVFAFVNTRCQKDGNLAAIECR